MSNPENSYNNLGVKPQKSMNKSIKYCALLMAAFLAGSEIRADNNNREGSIKQTIFSDIASEHIKNNINNIEGNIEQIDSTDIINNIQQRTGVKLPDGYDEIFRNLVNESILLKDPEISKFIEDFIVEHMKDNRGISQENQSVFLHNLCIEIASGKDGYNPPTDNNDKRFHEFKLALPIIKDNLENFIIVFEPEAATRIYRQLGHLRNFSDSLTDNSKKFNLEEFEREIALLQELIPICQLCGINPKNVLSSTIFDIVIQEYDLGDQ